MKVLVCGSRNWADVETIRRRLGLIPWVHPDVPTIIHGAASRKVEGVERSADMLAERVARDLGMRVERHPADWQTHGTAAGPIRNLAMLDRAPDLVLAFQRNGSRGTQHTIDEARKRGIPVEIFNA